jgi:hypothetical protein
MRICLLFLLISQFAQAQIFTNENTDSLINDIADHYYEQSCNLSIKVEPLKYCIFTDSLQSKPYTTLFVTYRQNMTSDETISLVLKDNLLFRKRYLGHYRSAIRLDILNDGTPFVIFVIK